MNQINSIKDIEKLIEDKIQESLILEYKREVDKDIPKDASAFATTNRYGKFIYNYKIPRITETRDIVIKTDVSTSDGRKGSSYKYVTVKRR